MLQRLYVHNFRTFVNFEWSPPRTCVLVGANGTGKTALVEVIWLIQDLLVSGDELDAAFGSTRTAWLQETKQTVEIDLTIEGQAFCYRVEIEAGGPRPALAETLTVEGVLLYRAREGVVELFGNHGADGARTNIPFDRRRSFLAVLEARPDNTKLIAFRHAIAAVYAMKPAPWLLTSAATGESSHLDRNLHNFSSWYRSRVQEDPEGTDALRADLRGVLDGFSSLRFVGVGPTAKEISVKFGFGEHSHDVSWPNLSDGQRALVALYGMLRLGLTRASLVVLDECENYVGPREIQPWFRALVAATQEANVQLLVLSHHPGTIDYLAADAIWELTRDSAGGHTRVATLPIDLNAGESASEMLAMGLDRE